MEDYEEGNNNAERILNDSVFVDVVGCSVLHDCDEIIGNLPYFLIGNWRLVRRALVAQPMIEMITLLILVIIQRVLILCTS